MNFTKHLVLASTLVAATFATQSGTQAQSVTRSGSHTVSYGNQWMGGSYLASAYFHARRLPGSTPITTLDYGYAGVSSNASIRFLLRTSPLVDHVVNALARTGPAPWDGHFNLAVKGVTERSQRFTNQGVSYGLGLYRTFDLFPADVTASLSIAGIPVTVRGNVSAGVEATAVVNMIGGGYAGVGGVGRSWAYGRATAQAGFFGVSTGVELTSNFANTRVSPNAHADGRSPLYGGPATPQVIGSVALTIQPITMRLKVFVSLVIRYTATLVDWSSALVSRPNLLN
ncbi:MAG: hypothetical protein IT457_15365 [Planctomycetes bacterium]|nr:hypothetical protein [Planctomycetota bacterium]